MAGYDPREKVRASLGTDSHSKAERVSHQFNEMLEAYWAGLIETGTKHSDDRFAHIQAFANKLGFAYAPSQELANASIKELLGRIATASEQTDQPMVVDALLGGSNTPGTTLSDALERFWELTKNELINKSDGQKRKWRNPRKKAISNAISVIGDITLQELSRDHILQIQSWWIDRVETQKNKSKTANKDMITLKTILSRVCEDQRIELDVNWLFRKVLLQKLDDKRPPFSNDFVQNQLLDPVYHSKLNDEARLFLYAMADTGARISELVGLLPEEIILDGDIPYITIKPRKGHALKTPYSEREIPLVGCALYAFKQLPNGFIHYRQLKGGADSLSALLMQHLRAKKLLPTPEHKVYSLRHNFQDRLTNIGVPDRIQAQLMGHKFDSRPEYGSGGTLENKRDWLEKVCFVPPTEPT